MVGDDLSRDALDEAPVVERKKRGRPPKNVRYVDVKPGKDGGTAPTDLKEFFSTVTQGTFWLVGKVRQVPTWGISDGEAAEIGAIAHKCYRTLPVESKTWLGKRLDHFAPWIGLAVALGGTVIGKVQEEQKYRATVVRRVPPGQQAPAPSRPAAAAPGPQTNGGRPGMPGVFGVRPHPIDTRPSDPATPHAPDPLLSQVFDESIDAAG